MKYSKPLLMISPLLLAAGLLAGCGGNNNTLTVWVGDESVNFYQAKCDEFLEANPDFGFQIKVSGSDLGSIAGTILDDYTACADIYSVAHDNVGKLAKGAKAFPLIDEDLVAQVKADNTNEFIEAASSNVNNIKSLYAVPYISQALFLMYDKRYVTEEQAQTFEGLQQAAAAVGPTVAAVETTGTDLFNFGFPLLARKEADKSSTLELYTNGNAKNVNVQGDDQVAVGKWLRRFMGEDNGFAFPTDAKWTGDIQEGNTVAVIGGAWHVSAFEKAIGSTNTGYALIPNFTIKAEDAYGSVTENTVMRGGTFADCKVFMVNAAAKKEKYNPAQKLIAYLASKDVQDQSFIECNNIPAYNGFADKIDDLKAQHPELRDQQVALAKVQTKMAEYGMPQPFIDAKLNNYFYQNGADATYKAIAKDEKDGEWFYHGEDGIRQALYVIEYIFSHGQKPSSLPDVASLPNHTR